MPLHTARASGTILSAAIYNADQALSDANLSLVANIGQIAGFFADGTTGTTLNMAADSIVLQTAANGIPVWQSSPTFKTCTITTSGPVANGRDRSASFSNGAWIYFYFIWNGSTLATLCSPVRNNPVLPSGYTHWCYATAIRAIGTNLMNEVYCRGARVYYMTSDPPITRVVSGSNATVFTFVNLAPWIPPESRVALMNWTLNFIHTAQGVSFIGYWRNAVLQPNGVVMVAATTGAVTGIGIAVNTREVPTQTDQFLQYRMNGVPNTSGGLSLDVVGYLVTNGDS